MKDIILSSLVVGLVMAAVNAFLVARSNRKVGQQTDRIEKLVNGHSTAQAAEIKKLHADVARLLKLLPPDTPEEG